MRRDQDGGYLTDPGTLTQLKGKFRFLAARIG
jgi:hypothetical protein